MCEIDGMDAMDAAKEFNIRQEEEKMQFLANETSDYYARRAGDE